MLVLCDHKITWNVKFTVIGKNNTSEFWAIFWEWSNELSSNPENLISRLHRMEKTLRQAFYCLLNHDIKHRLWSSQLNFRNLGYMKNKANLRDLIAATGLVILLKFYPNHQFFSPCDLEIWWMTLENNRAPLLYYTKLCASFQIHRWIQIGVTVRKRSIWVKIGNFLPCVTLKFDGWPCKTIGHLFYATSSFVYHFIPIGEFKFELQSRNAQFGSNSTIFRPMRPWNLMDDLEKQ